MAKAIICDLDGTLADLRHRLPCILPPRRDWNEFFSLVKYDGVIEPVAEIIGHLQDEYKIIICSGRSDVCEADTRNWLLDNGITYDRLLMRRAGDYRKDAIIKAEMLQSLLKEDFEIEMVFDDRPQVVQMWKDAGLFVLQVPWHGQEDGSKVHVAPGRLTVMVGPSGAGKSSFLADPARQREFGFHPSQIVSSDQLRQDLCGDFRVQARNEDVFRALHAIVRTRLLNGVDTVVDATNIRRKDRLAVVDCALTDAVIQYIVIDRPLTEKKLTGGWRDEVPGLIEKHTEIFKMNLPSILAGDGLGRITVFDLREAK